MNIASKTHNNNTSTTHNNTTHNTQHTTTHNNTQQHNNNHNTSSTGLCYPFWRGRLLKPSGRHVGAWRSRRRAAKRRRDRRLRMHWRHEQQMALAAALNHSRGVGPVAHNAPWGQKSARAGERGSEQNYTATIRETPTPQPELFVLSDEGPGGVRSLTLVEPRRNGFCGTPRSRLVTSLPSCLLSVFLSRRWRTNWWRCAGSSILTSPGRLSKCPRSPLHPVIHAGAVCVSQSRRRNSWWKCLRSYPFLPCTGLWSRTWTFQFLMVVIVSVVKVFSVYTQDRVPQRLVKQNIVFQQRLHR